MPNLREYLRKKAERKEKKEKERDFGGMILRHRLAILTRSLFVLGILIGVGLLFYIQLHNQVYTGYATISSVDRQQYDSSICLDYANGFLIYSKDGISYTDSRGNAMWNQTFEMQNPMVRTAGGRVAVADYNGHIVYSIAQNGNTAEIDTNLPVRELAVSESGMVAAVLEDGDTTWIYLYDGQGETFAYQSHTMQKSGYPLALALSPDGRLLAVSYLFVESGSMKSSVAFYNFGSVGQNYVDNFVSGADYADSVIPELAFMDNNTAFAVGDNRLIIYSGDQRPRSSAEVFLDEEIQSVFYNENYIGLVFLDRTGAGRYRLDLYTTSGLVESSVYFDMDYKDIVLWKGGVIIYNETQCILTNLNGKERFHGEFEKPCLLFSPVSGKRYMAVTRESIDTIEMQ